MDSIGGIVRRCNPHIDEIATPDESPGHLSDLYVESNRSLAQRSSYTTLLPLHFTTVTSALSNSTDMRANSSHDAKNA